MICFSVVSDRYVVDAQYAFLLFQRRKLPEGEWIDNVHINVEDLE